MDVLSAVAGAAVVAVPAAGYIWHQHVQGGLLRANLAAVRGIADDFAFQLSTSRAANRGLRAELNVHEARDLAAHQLRSAAVAKGNHTRALKRAVEAVEAGH